MYYVLCIVYYVLCIMCYVLCIQVSHKRLHSKNLPNCDRYQFWNKYEFEFVCCANGSNGFFVVVGQFFSPGLTESFSVNSYRRYFGKWPKLNICCSVSLFVRFDDLSATTRREIVRLVYHLGSRKKQSDFIEFEPSGSFCIYVFALDRLHIFAW